MTRNDFAEAIAGAAVLFSIIAAVFALAGLS